MKTAGIIAEYNPFHNGHAYHIKRSRDVSGADNIAVVMSGDYTQRGEPAIINKYKRTRLALENGADIVMELPVMFASSSAEYFAHAAVYLLHSAKIADCICFGSETCDIKSLFETANTLSSETSGFRTALREQLSIGMAFAAARSVAAVSSMNLKDSAPLCAPNDILGTEYIKSIIRLNSNIKPYTILREGSSYNSVNIEGVFSSATSVRKAALCGEWDSVLLTVPALCADILRSSNLVKADDFSLLLHSELIKNAPEIIADIADIGEGLENRIISAAKIHYSFSDISNAVKTKRYAHSRIRRALLHIVLGITKNELQYFEGKPAYIRILGFKKEKEYLLKELESKSSLPIVINVKQHRNLRDKYPDAYRMMSIDIKASELYNAAAKSPQSEYTQSVVIV